MKHILVCKPQANGTWNYGCSCGSVKRTGLKFKASADALHSAHIKNVDRMLTLKK